MRTFTSPRSLHWRESLSGYVGFRDPARLVDPDNEDGWAKVTLHLELEIPDYERFWEDRITPPHPGHVLRASDIPEHEHHVSIVKSWVESPALGGCCRVTGGFISLLDDVPEPDGGGAVVLDDRHQRMYYCVEFDTKHGPLTLGGYKEVEGPASGFWSDTTTLLCHIYEGRGESVGEPSPDILATGILRVSLIGFFRLSLSFRPGKKGDVLDGVRGTVTFFSGFLGHLWRVYGPGARPRTAAKGC